MRYGYGMAKSIPGPSGHKESRSLHATHEYDSIKRFQTIESHSTYPNPNTTLRDSNLGSQIEYRQYPTNNSGTPHNRPRFIRASW